MIKMGENKRIEKERNEHMEQMLSQILNELKDFHEEMRDVKYDVRETKQELREFKEETRREFKEVKEEQKEMNQDIAEIKEKQNTMEKDIAEIKEKQNTMEKDIAEIKEKQNIMRQDIKENRNSIKEATDFIIETVRSIEKTITNNQAKQMRQLMLMRNVGLEKDKSQDAILALHHTRIEKCEDKIAELLK